MIIRRLTDWPSGPSKSPFDELERMRREMDRLFQDLGGSLSRETMAGVFPLVNVTEDKGAYYVRAELPGINAEELDISMAADGISIAGERKILSEEEKAIYHRREREGGTFSRMISLPGEVDASKVEAHYSNGVLTVTLPKAEAAKPKQISVKTA